MTNKAAIAEEIAALKDCDPITLRRRYHELTGADAAAFGARFMQRRCAHRLQELAFGGLSDDELSTLAYIAEHDPQINKTLRDAPRSANDSRGVTFRREYRGRIYEITLPQGAPDGAPIAKRLLWDENTMFANYEGLSLGPDRPDGSCTLVLVADGGGGADANVLILVGR